MGNPFTKTMSVNDVSSSENKRQMTQTHRMNAGGDSSVVFRKAEQKCRKNSAMLNVVDETAGNLAKLHLESPRYQAQYLCGDVTEDIESGDLESESTTDDDKGEANTSSDMSQIGSTPSVTASVLLPPEGLTDSSSSADSQEDSIYNSSSDDSQMDHDLSFLDKMITKVPTQHQDIFYGLERADTIPDDPICDLCSVEFEPNRYGLVKSACGHYFCEMCIIYWLRYSVICKTCGENLSSGKKENE